MWGKKAPISNNLFLELNTLLPKEDKPQVSSSFIHPVQSPAFWGMCNPVCLGRMKTLMISQFLKLKDKLSSPNFPNVQW